MQLNEKINSKIIIGITGGIGSGKSVVSDVLRIMNFPVYDSDSNAKFLMSVSCDIHKALIDRFGHEIFIGNGLNRDLLAKLIFNDKENLQYVNSIVHPVVCRDFMRWAELQVSDKVFVESAILFSSGLDKYVDFSVYVDAPEDIRIERVMNRNNTIREKVISRINNQRCEQDFARENSRYCILNDNKSLLMPQILDIIKYA